MGWTCTLYRGFSKRVNSTLQPSGGETYDCRIKNDTDFKAPVLEVSATDLHDVTYMQFNGEFFYVVSLISHRTGVWEIAGQRDPMATYKAAIGSTNAFMLYGDGPEVDDDTHRVSDERLALNRVPQCTETMFPLAGDNIRYSSAGTYILSAVGESGGVASYALNGGQMGALLNNLGTDSVQKFINEWNVQSIPSDETAALCDIRNGLWATLSNELAFGQAINAIRACIWIPFTIFTGTSSEIVLGDYHTGVNGLKLEAQDILKRDSFPIPLSWPVDDWKRNNCMVQITLPLCGVVPLPVDKINNATFINIIMTLDVLGGNVSYLVEADTVVFGEFGANTAVPYAIGSSNVSLQNFISGSLQAVGGGIQAAGGAWSAIASAGIFGAGDIAGGITSMAQGAMQAITPQVQCSGSVGGNSALALRPAITLNTMYFPPIDEEATQAAFGHPVMAMHTPTAGYNMFRAFSVSCSGSPDEIARINSFFNSGAYYE